MSEEEFHKKRKPFYLESDTLLVKFPTIKWIGLGCNKGALGEVWTPKLKITRG